MHGRVVVGPTIHTDAEEQQEGGDSYDIHRSIID